MGDVLDDMECLIVDVHHWSLRDIDETDMESLIRFFFQYPRWKGKQATNKGLPTRKVYADQAEL